MLEIGEYFSRIVCGWSCKNYVWKVGLVELSRYMRRAVQKTI
jgi:hypothetical protein